MKVALAQIDVRSGAPEENLKKGEAFCKRAKEEGCDLILFPEMWTTSFWWEYNLSHLDEQKETLTKIQKLAKTYSLYIGGSILFPDERKGKNRFYLIGPNGEIVAQYDKLHLFSFVGEDQKLEKGAHTTLVDTPWGKGGLSICYDIRFPELYREYALQGAKFVMVPSGFPHPRKEHLVTLAKARAIENQMFVFFVNHVGEEEYREEPVNYFGTSMVIDPWGDVLAKGSEDQEELITCEIDLNEVDRIRGKMHVFKDRRPDVYA